MANKLDVRGAAQALAKEIEAMLEETVPVTPAPAAQPVKLMEGIHWPAKRGDTVDWASVAGRGGAVSLVATTTGATDLAMWASSHCSPKEKDTLVAGLAHALEVARGRTKRRQDRVREILAEPVERDALRKLRSEYTLMQLEEIKID